MDIAHTFLLNEVIDDLVKGETSLVSPIMKLRVLAKLIKNEPLHTYTIREIEGYWKLDESEIPDYRKTPGTIYIDLYSLGSTATRPVSPSILENPKFDGHFRFLTFREGIETIEQMSKDRGNGKEAEQLVHTPFPLELLTLFEQAIRKKNPGRPIQVTRGGLSGNAYRVTEIPTIVRSRLLNFTMELTDQFGMKIDISSFNKQKENNNQIIINIMSKTEITNNGDGSINTGITNTGDGNLINTGDHATQTATISINKGDWGKLQKSLEEHGIDEEDIKELKTIVDAEKPEGATLGNKSIDWIMKVSGKALKGIGKIATGVSSNLLATWIKGYYHI